MGGVRLPAPRLRRRSRPASPAPSREGGKGVRVSLDGSFSPNELQRHRFSPVSITLEGAVHGTEGQLPPPIGRIDIDFGSNASLNTEGLPTCRRSQLVASDLPHAMEVCGPALVGKGSVDAILEFPDGTPHEVKAHLLAFNGRSKEPDAVVWALVSPYDPALATSFVLPFYLQGIPTGGAFGHRIRAPVFHNPARFWRLQPVQRHPRAPLHGRRRAAQLPRRPLPAAAALPQLQHPAGPGHLSVRSETRRLGRYLSRLPSPRLTARSALPPENRADAFRLSCAVQRRRWEHTGE